MKRDSHPVYLGVELNCTLSYREHVVMLKIHNNLLSKLAGTT